MKKQQIGVVGLAVMGKNLALNIESKGFSVSVYNRSPEKTKELLDRSARQEFRRHIQRGGIRAIARGAAQNSDHGQSRSTDRRYDQPACAVLRQGDILIDGGNAYLPGHAAPQ